MKARVRDVILPKLLHVVVNQFEYFVKTVIATITVTKDHIIPILLAKS